MIESGIAGRLTEAGARWPVLLIVTSSLRYRKPSKAYSRKSTHRLLYLGLRGIIELVHAIMLWLLEKSHARLRTITSDSAPRTGAAFGRQEV